ncbi:MAG: hypothetical protein ACRC46_13580 [Thermoguttaceae bacterium]
MSTATSRNAALATIEVWEVMLDTATIKFFAPLRVVPHVVPPEDATDTPLLVVEIPELGVVAHGTTYDDVRECLHSCIRVGWREYAEEDTKNLSPLAQGYRNNYLAMAETVAYDG